jgi:hypothetical protein
MGNAIELLIYIYIYIYFFLEDSNGERGVSSGGEDDFKEFASFGGGA